MSIGQSVEAPATINDRFVIGGSLMAENGIGSGGLSLTWRRLLGASMWAEVLAVQFQKQLFFLTGSCVL